MVLVYLQPVVHLLLAQFSLLINVMIKLAKKILEIALFLLLVQQMLQFFVLMELAPHKELIAKVLKLAH